jgi:hypothetical protein
MNDNIESENSEIEIKSFAELLVKDFDEICITKNEASEIEVTVKTKDKSKDDNKKDDSKETKEKIIIPYVPPQDRSWEVRFMVLMQVVRIEGSVDTQDEDDQRREIEERHTANDKIIKEGLREPLRVKKIRIIRKRK